MDVRSERWDDLSSEQIRLEPNLTLKSRCEDLDCRWFFIWTQSFGFGQRQEFPDVRSESVFDSLDQGGPNPRDVWTNMTASGQRGSRLRRDEVLRAVQEKGCPVMILELSLFWTSGSSWV